MTTAFGPHCALGEGALWHPLINRLFWFDIPAGILYRANGDGTDIERWSLSESASAAGWVDEVHLLVATASGFKLLNLESGAIEAKASLEADNSNTRSNDGRVAPDGSFWLGTMALDMQPRAGAFYRLKNGQVETLFNEVSIPNATCFSPDGKIAYLADTRRQLIWRWPLDEQGNPIGEREVHINLREEALNPDGAVCDAEGYLWNAQWGASRVARYRPDGTFDYAVELPASQITCPAFGGSDLKTLYITSASEGLSDEARSREPEAGRVFAVPVDVEGISEHQMLLT